MEVSVSNIGIVLQQCTLCLQPGSFYLVQLKERIIQTLGNLPVGDGDFPHQKKLLQGLMDSVEVRTLH